MTPFEIQFRRFAGPPPLGADGLVRALADTTGLLDIDTARVLSGVAFRAYFLTPDDNHAYRTAIDDREWAWSSLDVENYGVVESLAAHLEQDVRVYPIGRAADLIALAKFEIAAGRTPIGRLAGEVPEHVVVTGLRTPSATFELDPGVAPGDVERVPIADPGAPVNAIAPHLAEVVTIRPPTSPIPETRRRMLRDDVMQFASRHSRSRKELHHAQELFYASGLRAWSVAAELLTERWQEKDVEEFERFWAAWTSDARAGRAAAARVFARWAEDEVAFGPVAEAYRQIPDAIPETSPGFDWNEPVARGHVASALRDAEDLDEAAVTALEDALAER